MDAGIDSTDPKAKSKYAPEEHSGHADPPDDWDGPSSAVAESCAQGSHKFYIFTQGEILGVTKQTDHRIHHEVVSSRYDYRSPGATGSTAIWAFQERLEKGEIDITAEL